MSQKINLQQLQALTLTEVTAHRTKATIRKNELEALKAKGGKGWTPELQEELDDIALFLVDINDVIEEKTAQIKEKANNYKPKPGTENMVHVSLIHGHRFNPRTGEEESKPFVQLFTYSEWLLFKKNYVGLGYTIEILHNPYDNEKD